jgi:hypothetical protein
MSFGIYLYSYFLNKKEGTNNTSKKIIHSQQEKTIIASSNTVKENKYYIVYIKRDNGAGSSFVPLKLNPGFRNDSDFHVNISFDDYGKIINGDKIIVIDHYKISKDNKKMIKKITGKEHYEEALKEIEDRVQNTKEYVGK